MNTTIEVPSELTTETNNSFEIDYNRILHYALTINKTPIFLDVLFNKHNNIVNFEYGINTDLTEQNDGKVEFKVIRNLDNSQFAALFLKLKSSNSYFENGCLDDRKNSFVYEYHSKQFYPIFNETFNMSKKQMNRPVYPYSTDPNHISVKAYGLNDYKNQYMFMFVERTKFNFKSNTIKTRTAAIEIYNPNLDLNEIF